MAIQSFANKGTKDVFEGNDTSDARKTCPTELLRVAQRKLDQISTVTQLRSLAVPSGNRLEALKGNRRGQHRIRINDRYRVCFVWSDAGATEVEIVDYH